MTLSQMQDAAHVLLAQLYQEGWLGFGSKS